MPGLSKRSVHTGDGTSEAAAAAAGTVEEAEALVARKPRHLRNGTKRPGSHAGLSAEIRVRARRHFVPSSTSFQGHAAVTIERLCPPLHARCHRSGYKFKCKSWYETKRSTQVCMRHVARTLHVVCGTRVLLLAGECKRCGNTSLTLVIL